jgi:hypothetical protein
MPLDRGYIHCSNVWHKRIFHIDCRAGGAQQVFDDVCRAFERAGWDIGSRSFDSRIMRRAGISWSIIIVSRLPEPASFPSPD